MMQLGAAAGKAAVKMWKKVLESFGIVDTDSYVPDIEAVLSGTTVPNPMGGMNGQLEGSSPGQATQSSVGVPTGFNPQDAGGNGQQTVQPQGFTGGTAPFAG
jgi:hypothetical protein